MIVRHKRLISNEIEALRNTSRSFQTKYVELYRSQFRVISRIIDSYCLKHSYEISSAMVDGFQKEMRVFLEELISSEYFGRLEDRINRSTDNILEKIRNDYPSFEDSDIRFISYVIIGLDNMAIATILDNSLENTRLKKHRYLKKLLSNTGPNMEIYHLWLGSKPQTDICPPRIVL